MIHVANQLCSFLQKIAKHNAVKQKELFGVWRKLQQYLLLSKSHLCMCATILTLIYSHCIHATSTLPFHDNIWILVFHWLHLKLPLTLLSLHLLLCCFPLPFTGEPTLTWRTGTVWSLVPSSLNKQAVRPVYLCEHVVYLEGKISTWKVRNLSLTNAISKLGTNKMSFSWVKRKGNGGSNTGFGQEKRRTMATIRMYVQTHTSILQRKSDLWNDGVKILAVHPCWGKTAVATPRETTAATLLHSTWGGQ